jgi:hypothetical protein
VDSKEKLLEIARRLARRTSTGGVKWERTSEDTTFQVSLEDVSVLVWSRRGLFGLSVMNASGTVVDGISTDSFLGEPELLPGLYDMARRDALQVDRTIDDVLRKLS